MPNSDVEKRAIELEVTLKALPVIARITPIESPQKQPAGALDLDGVPAGQLREFPDSVKITSRVSMQRQFIPRGSKQFRDIITGEIEEV